VGPHFSPGNEQEQHEQKEIGIMESKPAQNIQDTFLNTVRKDKTPVTIYLVSGVKLTGKIRSFDKYSVLLENNSQEQLIFKHAISTVVSGRVGPHADAKVEGRPQGVAAGHPASSATLPEAASVAGD
jgi:host factor-I protein